MSPAVAGPLPAGGTPVRPRVKVRELLRTPSGFGTPLCQALILTGAILIFLSMTTSSWISSDASRRAGLTDHPPRPDSGQQDAGLLAGQALLSAAKDERADSF